MDDITPATTVTIPIIVISLEPNPRGAKRLDSTDPKAMKDPSTKVKHIISNTKFLSLMAALNAGTKCFSLGC